MGVDLREVMDGCIFDNSKCKMKKKKSNGKSKPVTDENGIIQYSGIIEKLPFPVAADVVYWFFVHPSPSMPFGHLEFYCEGTSRIDAAGGPAVLKEVSIGGCNHIFYDFVFKYFIVMSINTLFCVPGRC